MNSLMGLYIHIPFCIQRCSYCDFATYAKDQISPQPEYVDTLLLEAKKRIHLMPQKTVHTIYFGGGTPSLLPASEICRILVGLEEMGIQKSPDCEVTIEVNPATLTEEKCRELRQGGVNRVSIGCQSFKDENLKRCNREHDVSDTLRTIELAKKYFDNYSLDLLFSLPKQNMEDLVYDLNVIKEIQPPHVSAYCLTVPDKHPMNQNRCSDEEQVEMFERIRTDFLEIGLKRYEISNFSKPGFESRHNSIYWMDQNYWALGLSSHAYFNKPDWGYRFWNPSTYSGYMDLIKNLKPGLSFEESYKGFFEKLSFEDSLTDFCHTHLRMSRGLSEHSLRQKFGDLALSNVQKRIEPLVESRHLEKVGSAWSLTEKGLLLSNYVFSELLFSGSAVDKTQSEPILSVKQ